MTTVHSTYLTDAVNHGAELFTGANVRLVERVSGDLWRVVFRKIGDKDSHVPVGTVTAAMVVLAAGTLGTAEIMMRSRENGLRVSDRLGWRFSTNADVMSFGYNYKEPVNSVGLPHGTKAKVPPPGPAVVGLIDLRRRRDPLDRLALVEATVPSAMAQLMPTTRQLAALNAVPMQPAIPFAQTKGSLPLPAQGKRVLGYGEKTQFGTQSMGIVLETRHSAQVRSPSDGSVIWAAPFRTWGQLLIINAEDGYHILLAGLSQIDVQVGQFVLAGEPIGLMSAAPRSQSAKSEGNAPVLYVEFRKDYRPIDPDPWWAARS